jgi:hypothetical protein
MQLFVFTHFFFQYYLKKGLFQRFASASWKNKILGEIQDLSYKKTFKV